MTLEKQQDAWLWDGHLQAAQQVDVSARKGMAAMRSHPLGFCLLRMERMMSLWLRHETLSQSAKLVSLDARPARRSTAEFSAR